MKKNTYEEIYLLLKENGSELLSKEYINSKQKLHIKCKCGEVFFKTLDSMNRYKKYMCNKCADKESRNNRKIKYEKIKHNIEKCGYILLTSKEEYIDASQRLSIKCSKGHISNVLYYNFTNKNQICKKCNIDNRARNQRIPYQKIVDYVDSIGYELITSEEDYIDTKHYVFVNCDKGHIHKTKINSLKNGKRCKECSTERASKKRIIPYEKRKEFVESFGYKLLTPKEDYGKLHDKYLFECNNKHKYQATLSDFQQGCRCPVCNLYKGEEKVKLILEKYNIDYIAQYKFDDCKFYHRLPFDFYLPEYNVCIEYDGKQHFQFVNTWGGYDEFVNRKIRDTIKNEYCKNNGIKLIRIPYWEFDNIENILLNKLKLRQGNTEVNN